MLPIRLPRKTQPQLASIGAAGVALDPRQRQQAEAAGHEIEPEQHDQDETDREDQRADQRLAGLIAPPNGEAGRGAEMRPRVRRG